MNQRFLPSALEKDEDIVKLSQLIRTYFKLKGHHIQFNVVGTDTLKRPRQHRMTTRICWCGWRVTATTLLVWMNFTRKKLLNGQSMKSFNPNISYNLTRNSLVAFICQRIVMILQVNQNGTVRHKGITGYLIRQVSPFGLS